MSSSEKTETKVETITVRRALLVKLYKMLGFKTANNWDCKRFERKIKNLPDYIGENEVELPNPKAQKFLDRILKALKKGKVIEVVDEKEKDKNENLEKETTMSKSKNKKKKTTENEKKTTKKKEAVKKEKGIDAFGRRLGTQGALIDSCLSKEPKSVETLAKECKLPVQRIRTHLNDLEEKGFIKSNKDGNYSVK